MENEVFDFEFLDNSIGYDKCMDFYCPVCRDIHEAIGLHEYIPHHDFYIGKEFFCSNCMSQFKIVRDNKIKIISQSLYFD